MRKLLGTIRVRLTIWNSLVVLLAAFLALFAAREGMKYALELETRELLREELTELEFAVKQLHPKQNRIADEFERKVLSHSRHEWFARLIDRETEAALWQSSNYPQEFQSVDTTNIEPFSFRRTDGFIVASHAVITDDGREFIIMLGEPTTFIERDVGNLTKIMLLIGVAILVIAPFGGYFLARNAMQPVRNIVDTTRGLEPSRLDSRLTLRGTGDELDQISSEINSFVDLISHYLSGQREFIANAAHELRSPLTAIQTSVEVCLTQTRSSDEYREQLETVSEQCQTLRHLVNQLLELADADAAAKVHKTEFDFTELINKSISVFLGVADEKGVSVVAHLKPELKFNGDSSKLMQVVNNLIDNAIKFTPTGGTVEVELTKSATEIHFTVRDSGPGVPADALQKIFERFYQVDSSRQRDTTRGNGLGLSICRSIVTLHGGTIIAENVPGGGLLIQMTVPSRQ